MTERRGLSPAVAAALLIAGCGTGHSAPRGVPASSTTSSATSSATAPAPTPTGALACVPEGPMTAAGLPADLRSDVFVDVRLVVIDNGGPTDFVRTYFAHPGQRVTLVTGRQCQGAWFDDSGLAGRLRRVREQPARDRPGDQTAVVYEAVRTGEARVPIHGATGHDGCADGAASSRGCRVIGTVVLDVR
jgi:dipeptidyl aminopeptidase/acylaminoacyl peptidase